MLFNKTDYLSLPSEPGVYRFLDENNKILYVGKANDLKARVSSYFTLSGLGPKTSALVSKIKKIKIIVVQSEVEALLLEAFYIKKYQPKYNIDLKDNKAFLRLKINHKDRYPSLILVRRDDDDPRYLYFGPYTSASSLRLVLRTLRRVYPFVSVRNHLKRVCLYHHLGLCPCPQVFDSPELKKEYSKNINNIIKILEGGAPRIMRELEKARDEYSKSEEYEKASQIQQKINALSIITTPFRKPFEYDINPNLRADIRQNELTSLIEALNNTQSNFVSKLDRIECYDISNIQGTNPTASMVVLTHGEIDKSQYRKFKMKTKGPNDFAMMQEVLERRLKHTEWQFPDLIIVDGGKGQVSSALRIIKQSKFNIPLVGLAKRYETIILPILYKKNSIDNENKILNSVKKNLQKNYKLDSLSFSEVSLPKNSPALHLIMRIRDEAHRFAITFHKKLRGRNALSAK